jgi:dGTPase
VHDLEDGLHAGLIQLDWLRDPAQIGVIARLTLASYCPPGSATEAELAEVFARLLGLEFWPRRFDGGLHAAAAVKSLTSELIGRFCGSAEQATRPAGHPPLTRYDADLIVPRQQRLECALLKGVTAHYVMSRPGAAAAQAREREVITELTHAVAAGAPGTLDPMFAAAFQAAATDAARQRVVIDQIASLTDTSAISWHDQLCEGAATT